MIIRESQDPTIRDYALDIRSSGKALLALVNDVLDFSRIESGRMELVIEEYDVSSMINDVVNVIANRATQKGLKFEVEADSQMPHLLVGDVVRLKQIMMNLLTNAVKYTDRGDVKLCLNYEKLDNQQVKLSIMVRDTGKGIKKEDLDKLFTPFERIEEKRNRNIEGTGLGMSITKRLLALMDSDLEVESVYGLGSDFSFSVVQTVKEWSPIGDYQETYRKMRDAEKEYHEQFVAPDAKVLIVDDTPVNVKVFVSLLKKTKVQIDTAYSGMDCLKLAVKKQYDIIFIDHMMPEMDGIETLEHLRNDDDSLNKSVPMIALTANALTGSREQYLSAGFDEYLTKPIDPVQLEKMLCELLPQELVRLA